MQADDRFRALPARSQGHLEGQQGVDTVEKLACVTDSALTFVFSVVPGLLAMMGERRVMQEAVFYGFSLKRHVPDNHLLRKIDRFVDFRRSGRTGALL